MVNISINYDDVVRNSTKEVYYELDRQRAIHNLTQQVTLDVRLGDVYGPNRQSVAIQINLPTAFILVECNSGKWRMGFYRHSDSEASSGIVFNTNYTPDQPGNEHIAKMLFEFILTVV